MIRCKQDAISNLEWLKSNTKSETMVEIYQDLLDYLSNLDNTRMEIVVEKSDEDTITISTNGNYFANYDASEYNEVSALKDYIDDYWENYGQYAYSRENR